MASMFDPMRYSGPTSSGRRRKGRCCREKQRQFITKFPIELIHASPWQTWCVCVCACVRVCTYLGYVSHKTILVGHFPYESKHTSICWCGTTERWLNLQHSLSFQDDVASKVHCETHTPAVHRSYSSCGWRDGMWCAWFVCVHTQTCGVRELIHDMSAIFPASFQFALHHTATVWRKGALANTIL